MGRVYLYLRENLINMKRSCLKNPLRVMHDQVGSNAGFVEPTTHSTFALVSRPIVTLERDGDNPNAGLFGRW